MLIRQMSTVSGTQEADGKLLGDKLSLGTSAKIVKFSILLSKSVVYKKTYYDLEAASWLFKSSNYMKSRNVSIPAGKDNQYTNTLLNKVALMKQTPSQITAMMCPLLVLISNNIFSVEFIRRMRLLLATTIGRN